MDINSSLPLGQARSRAAAKPDRLFYTATGALLVAVMFVGFRHFYFQGGAYPGRPLAPEVKWLAIAHGLTMGAWMVLYLIQASLIASRRHRLHMKLGWAGLAVGVASIVSGLWLVVEATRLMPADFRLFTLTGKQFTAVSMINMVVFGGFVGVGIWQRRRPGIHRPMMMLATLCVTPAAFARIDSITLLYQGTAWERWLGPFLPMLVLGGALLAAKWLISRAFDRWLALGFGVLAAACAGIMWVATTSGWARFANWIVG